MARRIRITRSRSSPLREAAKDRMIADLVTSRQDILDAVRGLSREKQKEVFLGEWSVKEILAHLIGWDRTYVAAVQDLLAEELPSFYSAYDADWVGYNRNLVNEYKRDNWTELLEAVEQSHQELIDFLKTLPGEEFDKDRGVRYNSAPVTIARLLKAEAKDEREHYRQIKEWAG